MRPSPSLRPAGSTPPRVIQDPRHLHTIHVPSVCQTATATYISEAESLARKGETMTAAAMATYAYDQIDQARAELNAVSK